MPRRKNFDEYNNQDMDNEKEQEGEFSEDFEEVEENISEEEEEKTVYINVPRKGPYDDKELIRLADQIEDRLDLDELKRLPLEELQELAKEYKIEDARGKLKDQLIAEICKEHYNRGGIIFGSGVLEIVTPTAVAQQTDIVSIVTNRKATIPKDPYGFLRSIHNNYEPSEHDIYISSSQLKKFGLREGDTIYGVIRPPRMEEAKKEKHFAMLAIKKVNGISIDDSEQSIRAIRNRQLFENLTPYFPTEKFKLGINRMDLTARIIDLFVPIGKGQRGLIVAPPRSGKTTLIKEIAKSILVNHPEVYVIVLLIDERPEEVTDWKKFVDETVSTYDLDINRVEVVASTFDKDPKSHDRLARIVLEKAKRLVEIKKDVVILLDSLTRMTRAYNLMIEKTTGRVLSGGLEASSFREPKKFFGAARNIEEGGSLTILATALIDTGSKMDEVIYEEFKGTGNMEIHLDRDLANKRIFPALDLKLSGTRKEELLLPHSALEKIRILRKAFDTMSNDEIVENLKNALVKTANNQEFLENISRYIEKT